MNKVGVSVPVSTEPLQSSLACVGACVCACACVCAQVRQQSAAVIASNGWQQLGAPGVASDPSKGAHTALPDACHCFLRALVCCYLQECILARSSASIESLIAK